MLQEIISCFMVVCTGWFGYRCATPRGRHTETRSGDKPLWQRPFLALCPLCDERIYAFKGVDYEEALALAEVSHFEKTGHFGELIAFSDVPPRRLGMTMTFTEAMNKAALAELMERVINMPPTKPLPPPIRSIMLSRSESEKRFGGIRPPPPPPQVPRNVAMSDLMSDREEGPTHSHFFNNTCQRCACGLTLEEHAFRVCTRHTAGALYTEPMADVVRRTERTIK